MIDWWRTDFTAAESEAASKAIMDKKLSTGSISNEFEEKFAELLNVDYAVLCPSGTMSLTMSLLATGISKDDEVIVPANTWISTAHAPMLIGANVKLVDVYDKKNIINHKIIEKNISKKTKAIIPVHLNGKAAAMDKIFDIADKYGLIVIEDACQALLSKKNNKYLGTQGITGCFSLGVTKLITTGQGGVVVTNDSNIYEKLLLIRNNGMEDILTPEYKMFGANFKFSDVLAAIGIVQLRKAKMHAELVRKLYTVYEKEISDLNFLHLINVDYNRGELPLYVEVITSKREELMQYLSVKNIQTRVLPPSLNKAPQFNSNGSFNNSEYFSSNGMYLPSGPDQNESDIDTVINSIKEFSRIIN